MSLERAVDETRVSDDGVRRELIFAQRLLAAYTEITSLALIRWDREYRILEWSARAESIFGWRAGEVVGKTFPELRLVHPADVKTTIHAARALIAEQGTAIVENRNVTRDGRVIEARWFNVCVVHENELHVVSLVEDISDLAATRAAALESEERFRSLFDQSPDAMYALSLDGIVTRANAAAQLEHGGRELATAAIGELFAHDDARDVGEIFHRATAGRSSSLEVEALRADGSSYPVLATMIPIFARSEIAGVHLVMRDLSAIRRAERAVALQNERLRELYIAAASANETGENQIAATIDAGCRLLGMTGGALYDAETDRWSATAGDSIPRPLARLALATEGPFALDDLIGLDEVAKLAPGEAMPYAFLAIAVDVAGARFGSLCFASRDQRGEPFSASDRDLLALMGILVGSAIERSRSRARLKHLAYNDQLTALPNRAWFNERLREELARARRSDARVAVMFLDLDRFKDINDTLGHALGDKLLRTIGDRLTAIVGGNGVVARMGGDEFIVLVIGDATTARLESLARQIVGAVDQPIVIDGFEQFVTTSVGIAVAPDDGDDVDELIKNADVAMYRAKERGRNTHQFFDSALGASLQSRIAQEKQLRRALERDEFVVHYQPQFDLEGDRVIALEALVRWQHPRLGLVQPDAFIPAAELSGLIVPLGDWVLETGCRQLRQWQRLVPDLRLAVNLSARQFHQPGLTERVRDVLDRYAIAPGSLELEITESVAMGDAALSVQILEELGRAGIRRAVDDFGTGYSSLGYLRRFRLDCLKIDKSFVQDVLVEPDDATIVRTVIAMAHSLGLEVCAEGVETAEQLAFLYDERCDRVQGFLLAQPMTVEEVDRFLARRGITTAVG
ncbi:MAG TPA: EAL domain-containing protein [Candidatus Elarobacter sp.]